MFKFIMALLLSLSFVSFVQASNNPVENNWDLIINPTVSSLPGKNGDAVKVTDFIITSLSNNVVIKNVIYNEGKCEGFLGDSKLMSMAEGEITVYRVPLIQNQKECLPTKLVIVTNKGKQSFVF